jgi:hypothetical protein
VEFERSPVLIETSAGRLADTTADVLLRSGFNMLGEWIAVDVANFQLSAKAPVESGVYAFTVDDVVVYIGLAQRGVRTRMGHYRRGHIRQKTSARIKALIAGTLAKGKQVKVLVALPSGPLDWNGLPVNIAAGLEVGLIRTIKPKWNLLGIGGPLGA